MPAGTWDAGVGLLPVFESQACPHTLSLMSERHEERHPWVLYWSKQSQSQACEHGLWAKTDRQTCSGPACVPCLLHSLGLVASPHSEPRFSHL